MDTNWLQPPIPTHFKVQTLVQPQWRLADLRNGFPWTSAQEELKKMICRQYGVQHCLLLDRARTGLYLLAKGLGLQREWVLTSCMHRPSAVLIHHLAGAMTFADVLDDFTMDPASAAKLLNAETDVLLVTHMYGKSADIRTLRELADRRKTMLIENCVHVPGGIRVDNQPLGSWGDAAILSFNVDKPLGGLLGGALITNREDIWRAVTALSLKPQGWGEAWNRMYTTYLAYRLKPLIMRWYPGKALRSPKNGVAEIEAFKIGAYARYQPLSIHPVQAAVALEALKKCPQVTQQRVENAPLLMDRIENSPYLILPQDDLRRPHSFLYFPILFNKGERFEISRQYAEMGVETKWRYYPLHLQKDFSRCRHAGLEGTEAAWRRHLLLPAGAGMAREEIDYLSECTRRILGNL
jgi:dTDP-4-amino-4,6-dideoxygalactose transaminase